MNNNSPLHGGPQGLENRRRFLFVLVTLGFVASWIIINSFFKTGWKTAAVLSFSVLAINFVYIIRSKDDFFGKLVIFGLAAGTAELFADAWLVEQTKTLFYEHKEPLLLDSPVYMPVAWSVVLVQIGYIGYHISLRKGLLLGTVATGLIGGLIIPVYESCARGAGWWLYEDPHHIIWNAPYYIILGEFLLALALPFLFRVIERREFYWTVPLGVIMGAWIWVSYLVAFRLVG